MKYTLLLISLALASTFLLPNSNAQIACLNFDQLETIADLSNSTGIDQFELVSLFMALCPENETVDLTEYYTKEEVDFRHNLTLQLVEEKLKNTENISAEVDTKINNWTEWVDAKIDLTNTLNRMADISEKSLDSSKINNRFDELEDDVDTLDRKYDDLTGTIKSQVNSTLSNYNFADIVRKYAPQQQYVQPDNTATILGGIIIVVLFLGGIFYLSKKGSKSPGNPFKQERLRYDEMDSSSLDDDSDEVYEEAMAYRPDPVRVRTKQQKRIADMKAKVNAARKVKDAKK